MLLLLFQQAAGRTAALNITEADDTVASSAVLALAGSVAVTESADTLSGTATLDLKAAAALSEAGDTLSATAQLAIAAAEGTAEQSDTVVAAGVLTIAASALLTEDDDTLSATSQFTISGSLNVTEDDDTLHGDSTLRLSNTGGFGEEPKRRRRKSPNQRAEYHLNLALEKAFEPKRPVKRDLEPWLAEIIEPPAPMPVPEFSPQIAGLGDYVAQIQAQLAQRKFELAQMEADDELLLLSL